MFEGSIWFGEEPQEPDNPAAVALARHIADHPVSTIQAAFRLLDHAISFEVRVPEDARITEGG